MVPDSEDSDDGDLSARDNEDGARGTDDDAAGTCKQELQLTLSFSFYLRFCFMSISLFIESSGKPPHYPS